MARAQTFLDELVARFNDVQLWDDMEPAVSDVVDRLRGVLP